MTLVMLSAFAVTGCKRDEIDDRADQKINAVRADSNEFYRAPTCPDGAVLGPKCGLVTVRAGMQDFQASFKTQKCSGLDDAACATKLDLAVESWVTARYNLAVVADVDKICAKTPGRCDDATEWEKVMLKSHDDAVQGLDERREYTINERRDQEQAARVAREQEAGFMATVAVGGAVVAANSRHHVRVIVIQAP